MDDAVDQKYKTKHFAKVWGAKAPPKPQNAVAPAAAGTAERRDPVDTQPKTMAELIASFSGDRMTPAAPEDRRHAATSMPHFGATRRDSCAYIARRSHT